MATLGDGGGFGRFSPALEKGEEARGEWARSRGEAARERESGSGRGVGGAHEASPLSPPGVGAGEAVGRGRTPVPTRVGGTGKGDKAGGAGPVSIPVTEKGNVLVPVHA